MRARLVMAATLVALLAGVPAHAIDTATAPPESLFAAGSAAYESGDYPGAADAWKALEERGISAPAVSYNLGNAYFKSGDLGRAVLWYERARRATPRDEDLRENLALVRTLLRDKQLIPEPGRVRRALTAWHNDLSTAESVAIASALYVLLCLVAILVVCRRAPWVNAWYRRASVVSPARFFGLDMTQDLVLALSLVFVVGGLFAGSAYLKVRAESARSEAVVVAEEVPVFSGPSRDATVQFNVHEGTRVSVRDARAGWVRIDLPGELTGWMSAEAMERI